MDRFLKFIVVFFLISGWIFSGFPQIFNLPPKIQEAKAQAPIPAYRASGTFTAGTGSITPPYPAGMAANDVCLLVAESENQAITLTTANGFVEVPTWSPQFAGTAATNPASRLAVFWKRTVGGDAAPVLADSGDHTTGVIHCFSGVITSGNPWNTGAGGNDGGVNSTTGHIPGSTTTVDNTLVVLIESTSNNATATTNCSAWTNADLANILERQDNSNTAGLGGGSCMATGEKATAGAYATTTVTMSVTTFKGAISLALKPELPTYNQSAYRLFNNTDSTDVGTTLALQDTAATLGSTGAAFRLRMLLHIGANQLNVSGKSFKLQFAQQSGTCDTGFVGETYADVTAATVIAYNDNPTPADGATLTANANDPTHGADTIVNQTYEELNNFTNSVSSISSGRDGKWDFSLKDNGALASTAYCFRVVQSDGTVLTTYTVIPQITTAAAATVSCSTNISSTSFGTLSTASVSTASPNASTTMTCNGALGCTLNVSDAGNGSSPGLSTSSPAYLIPSATVTLSAGTEGYGIQATTTTVGSGAQLGINSIYLKTGNDVGGLSLTNVLLASSTAAITNREVVVTHTAAISALTNAASYTDTITYSCVGN